MGGVTVFVMMLAKNEYLSVKEFIKAIWTWKQGWINYLWYMGALICIYVFFPILKLAFDTNKKVFVVFIITAAVFTFGNVLVNHAVSVVLGLAGYTHSVLNINVFNMFNPFIGIYGYTFVYFCMGGIAHVYEEKIRAISVYKRNICAAVAIICGCVFLFVLGIIFSRQSGEMWDVVWNGYDTVFTLINVCAVYVLSLSYTKHIKLIQLISVSTLGIYFMHMIFISIFRPLAINTMFFSTYSGCIVFAVLILILCAISNLCIKKIPLLKKIL